MQYLCCFCYWIEFFGFENIRKKTASVGSCNNLRELIETRHFFELLWRRGPLRFPQDRGLRSTSRMSQAVSKRLTRMTRKSSWFPTLLPDIYKVLHCRGYEIGTFFFRGRWKRLDTNILWWFFEGFPENNGAVFGMFHDESSLAVGWSKWMFDSPCSVLNLCTAECLMFSNTHKNANHHWPSSHKGSGIQSHHVGWKLNVYCKFTVLIQDISLAFS